MASMTVTASFLAGAVQPVSAPRPGLIMAKATQAAEGEKASVEFKSIAMAEDQLNGRRELVFAAATAAAAAIAGAALADDEPRPGTPEAKKKYAPICVMMPTAKICHK